MIALVLCAALGAAPASAGSAPAGDGAPASLGDDDASGDAASDGPADDGAAPADDDARPQETAPVGVAPPEPGAPSQALERCLRLVRAGERDAARRCYEEHASGDDDDARLARDLADLVGALKLPEPALTTPPPAQNDLGALFTSGKAELIGVSTLAGGYVAFLGGAAVVAASPIGFGGANAAIVLLAPVAGGAAGLGLSTAAALALPGMTSGDANLIRAGMLLGAFNSVVLPLDAALALTGNVLGGGLGSAGQPAAMALTMIAFTGAGAGLAAVTDLPESAGSLAVTTGLWSAVLALLAADMAKSYKQHPEASLWLITAAGDAGFAAGLAAAPFVPVTRAETWAVDVGGGIGLAAGASIAVFARAPNPFLGWGSMLVGTSVGMAAGFAAARYLPRALPEVVAVAPLASPEPSTRSVAVGGALTGRL